jgi:hypothetical protein
MAKEYGWDFSPANLEPQLGRPEVGFWQGAATGFDQGLASTVPGMAMRHLKSVAGAKMSKEEFDQSVYPSKGITWNNRMTWAEADSAYQARVDKEVYDDVSTRMTTGGKVGEFAGGFAGSALDPVNLLPLGGINVARGFAFNIAKMGAVNAALEATLYSPAEMALKSKEQMPTGGFNQYISNVALSAAIGGMFGAAGRGIAAMLDNTSLRLGEQGELGTRTLDPALVQTATIEAPAAPLGAPLQAPTSVLQASSVPSSASATPNAPTAAPSAPKTRGQKPVVTPYDNRQMDIGIRFPDEDHKRLYNLDPNKPDDLAWLAGNGLNVEDFNAYRSAVDRRVRGQREAVTRDGSAEREVPAPMLSGVNLSHSRRSFTDPDLADNIQRRFDITSADTTKNSPLRDKILQEELTARAKELAAQTPKDAPIPKQMPEEGVLVQRTSDGNIGKVGEIPLNEWYRRIFNPAFDETIMRKEGKGGPGEAVSFERRENWEGTLANKLQRLTPEQLDYTLFNLMNKSDVEALARHFGVAEGDLTAQTRAVQEAIQPRGEAVRETTNRGADRAIEDVLTSRSADAQARLDAEAKAVNTVDANDALTGIANIKTGQDAVTFISREFDLAKLRETSPETAKLVDRISRLDKKQEAVMRTMACLLGAKV